MMRVGDIIEVCRPVLCGSRLSHAWFPATIERVDGMSLVAVFADFSRREYERNPYVVKPMRGSHDKR